MDHFENVKHIPVLTPEEEQELFRQLRSGDVVAKDILIHHNLRLVAKIATQFTGRGVEFEDLAQEGCFGLIRAIDKFDVDKGFKFSTYAIHWIRQAIQRYINANYRGIRLPDHIAVKNFKLASIRHKLAHELNRAATMEEVAAAAEMEIEEVYFFKQITGDILSINNYINEEEKSGPQHMNFIENNSAMDPAELYEETELRETIENILDTFTPREREVIIRTFGLKTGKHETLIAIAKDYNLTRERIRQIKEKGLNKFKFRHKKRLKDFY